MSKSYRFPITGYDISFDLSKYYFFVFYISVSILQPIWGAWSDADVHAIRESILSNTTYHRLIRPTENMTVNVSLSLLTVNFLVRSVGKDAWCDFSFDYLSYHASIIWNEILVYHQFSVWRLENLDRLSFFLWIVYSRFHHFMFNQGLQHITTKHWLDLVLKIR